MNGKLKQPHRSKQEQGLVAGSRMAGAPARTGAAGRWGPGQVLASGWWRGGVDQTHISFSGLQVRGGKVATGGARGYGDPSPEVEGEVVRPSVCDGDGDARWSRWLDLGLY